MTKRDKTPKHELIKTIDGCIATINSGTIDIRKYIDDNNIIEARKTTVPLRESIIAMQKSLVKLAEFSQVGLKRKTPKNRI